MNRHIKILSSVEERELKKMTEDAKSLDEFKTIVYLLIDKVASFEIPNPYMN